MIGIDVLDPMLLDIGLQLEYTAQGYRSLGSTPIIETIDTSGYLWQRMCRRYEI